MNSYSSVSTNMELLLLTCLHSLEEAAFDPGNGGFDPWVTTIPWRREQLPTPVFLSGEFLGQKSLVRYSPWGRIESDTTEQLTHLKRLKSLKILRVHTTKSKDRQMQWITMKYLAG